MEAIPLAKNFFLVLLIIVFCIFVRNVIVKYSLGETTFTTGVKTTEFIEMPTLIFCNRPKIKSSVMKEYNYGQNPFGFSSYAEDFSSIDSNLWEVFDNISYKISRDFNISILSVDDFGNEITEELQVGANNFSDSKFKYELLETQNLLYGLCYTLIPDVQMKPNTNIHFVVNYTESLDENDIPQKLRLFMLSKDIYRGIYIGSWTTLVEPIIFDLPLSGKVELINIEVEKWDYYRCDSEKKMYYDCLATEIANLPFKNSPSRCIPIQWHGLFESVGSNLSRCSTYNENREITNEIMSEVWSNNLISECQKWCSGTQYVGKKDETDSIELSYKEGLHMSGFYLVTKSTTTKVHSEYLIYDFIGVISSVGGSLGLFVGFSFYDLICQFLDKSKDYIMKKQVHDFSTNTMNNQI